MYPSLLGSFYVSWKLPQRSLCVLGRLARGQKESARGMMGREERGSEAHFSPLPIVPRALSIFQLLLFLLGYLAEASAQERESTPVFGSLALKTFVAPFLPTRLNAPAVSQRLISIHHDLRMNIFGLYIFKCTNS